MSAGSAAVSISPSMPPRKLSKSPMCPLLYLLIGEDCSLCPRTLLRFRRTEALRSCVFLAHVGAVLGVTIILVASEMIYFGVEIGPDDDIGGTVRFRLTLLRKLVSASLAWRYYSAARFGRRGRRGVGRCRRRGSRWFGSGSSARQCYGFTG